MNIKKMVDRYQKSKIQEQTKIREVLQQTALLGLERHGFFEKAAFYGGTALRILYGLDRFSEDLDFTLLKQDSNFNFSPFLEGMKKEIASFGFELEVSEKDKKVETPVVSAFLKLDTLKYYLSIKEEKRANHNEKIQIKLEVDTDPPLKYRLENKLVLNPLPFNVLTLHPSDLFAGKMQAILFRTWKGRVKGRDWYDLIWYIQKKISLNLSYLEERMKQSGIDLKTPLNRDHLIELLQTKIQTIDWESAKSDMRSFISEPEKLDIWSPHFFTALLDHLQIED